MALLNFDDQWRDAIIVGATLANSELVPVALIDVPAKRSTIRRAGKVGAGDSILLSNGPHKLGRVLCLGVTPIGITLSGGDHGDAIVTLGREELYPEQWERLARLDTAGQMGGNDLLGYLFQRYGFPFKGELILW